MRGGAGRPMPAESYSPRVRGVATPKRSAGPDSLASPRRNPGREDGPSETQRGELTPDRLRAKAGRVPLPSPPSSVDEERWRLLRSRLCHELEVQVKLLGGDLQESLVRSLESLGTQQHSEEVLGRLQVLEELQAAGSEKLLRRLEGLSLESLGKQQQQLGRLQAIHELQVAGSKQHSEEVLGRLQALEELHAAGSKQQSEEVLGRLQALEELQVEGSKQQSGEVLGKLQALEELQTANSEKVLCRLEVMSRESLGRLQALEELQAAGCEKLLRMLEAQDSKEGGRGGTGASLAEELLERLQAFRDFFSEELRSGLQGIEERQVKGQATANEQLLGKLEEQRGALEQQQATANEQLLGTLEEQHSVLARQQAAANEQLLGKLSEEQRSVQATAKEQLLGKLEEQRSVLAEQATANEQLLGKLEEHCSVLGTQQATAYEQLLGKLEEHRSVLATQQATANEQLLGKLEEQRRASLQMRTSHRLLGLRRDSGLEELHGRLPMTPELPEDDLMCTRRSAMHARFSRDLAEPLLHVQATRTSLLSSRRRSVFPNAEEMKERVREAITSPSSCEEEGLYKNMGWAQRIARSHCFKDVSLAVMAINCIWIAVETDYNKAPLLCEAPVAFQVVDNLFCVFFVSEILVRVFALQRKSAALKSAWFVFDLVVVALMVWESWIVVALYVFVWGKAGARRDGGQTLAVMRIFRGLRLMRVARMARVLRALPELMILVKGMAVGMRAVSATLGLLVMCIYVFAILFTELMSGSDSTSHCFDTVLLSMNCLMLGGVFPDQVDLIKSMLNADWICYFLVLAFLTVTSLTIMNLLIGVTCEVVNVVAQVEKEEMLLKDLRCKIEAILSGCDEGDEVVVSREKFMLLLSTPDIMCGLHEAGVDLFSIVDFADFIFQAEGELSLSKFLEAVLKFRGSNAATVRDVADLRRHLSGELANIDKRLGHKH